uniref:SAM domain-containing protein n=2 Tax=Chlamydomonas euryale TaxID=1486919 RepID=A0A6U2IE74_9CHLO|mmetsp:Transcript_4273/g.12298  ORF Transcript_4273/g.12298 Transcript_4273/m.12298 type:complete len:383 (+) Transcript_4273:223-1371(+)
MAEHKPAELWNNDEVCAYLDRIGLSADVPAFRDNEVVGSDLASLTDDELKTDLGISKLHARRIKRYLEDGGASYAPSGGASAETKPEPPPTTTTTAATPAVPDLGGLHVQSHSAETPVANVPAPAQASSEDARKEKLQKEVDGMVAPLTTARQYMSSYTQALQILKTGHKLLAESHQHLSQAVKMANLEVVGEIAHPHRGGLLRGPMHGLGDRRGPLHRRDEHVGLDVIQNHQAKAGCELANKACEVLLKVYAIIPDVPKIKAEEIKGLQGMGLMNIMFDNLLTDMAVRKKVMGAQQKVAAILEDCQYAERWVEGWISSRLQPDLAAWESKYATAKAALDGHSQAVPMGYAMPAQTGPPPPAPGYAGGYYAPSNNPPGLAPR